MTNRKSGRRKTDLSDESSPKVLKVAKSLIRTDWGGKDPDEQIRKKAAEAGLDFGIRSRQFVKDEVERQVESCRKRIFPRIDEVIARLEDDSAPKALESSP